MIFSKKNAGKWVASKNGKVVDSSKMLDALLKKVEKRDDRKSISFDRVPGNLNFVG
jgi:HD superfamily phosphodiesterase